MWWCVKGPLSPSVPVAHTPLYDMLHDASSLMRPQLAIAVCRGLHLLWEQAGGQHDCMNLGCVYQCSVLRGSAYFYSSLKRQDSIDTSPCQS